MARWGVLAHAEMVQRCVALSEQFFDRFAAVDDLEGPADRADVFLVRIDLQRFADRAEEVRHGDRVVLDCRAVVRRGADHLPAANATPRHGRAEDARVMVASVVGIDPRRAAEFSHPDDERLVEHAALLEVGDQGRKRRDRPSPQCRATVFEVVLMRVPVEPHPATGLRRR